MGLYKLLLAFAFLPWRALAQDPVFSHEHGFYDEPFELTIVADVEGTATLRYTLDGSEPTERSAAYDGKPLAISGTTIVRAAIFDGDVCLSPVTTATYLFVEDILTQSNTPEGYPDTWGRYCQINGTAKADYEMDPEMTEDPVLRPKIIEGLRSLPVLSIVTDPDNLFSHEKDSVRGGIYIFTGNPLGDDTGRGWTRPASVELFEPNLNSQFLTLKSTGFSVTCGLRLHGGHSRLPEKNPKHSFRLVFKEKYGPKTLKYPLFGSDQPAKFDQLVLRCHFGTTWQHWDEGNRQRAQYTRDVWARRMQNRLGRTSVNALYVNLFLNGMYWGIYNIAERVDDLFGKDHIGGTEADVDAIKIEETGGYHLDASAGTLDSWKRTTALAAIVGGTFPGSLPKGIPAGITAEEAYKALKDSLLDIPAFIDFMLVNQYDGNTDWDHHNWYAVRSRGVDSKGFKLLCWDSEAILEDVKENNLGKNNGKNYPTGIFHNLLHNDDFARQYVRRAKKLLAPEGMLGEQSVVELWDSLHNVIAPALYAEAARWGDYRRDVHKYKKQGQLYTVDNQYAAERNRLLTQYFPYRSDIVIGQITSLVDIDDTDMEGDVNGDGTVDVADISSIISVMANSVGSGSPAAIAADVNDDGTVDVADVSAVIMIMASE